MARVVGVIPARWASTRFPGKALHVICGKSLLRWVVERARGAKGLADLLVATDDDRIRAAAESCGVRAVMTSPNHPSGTDRIAEAIRGIEADAAVNIQGDEPLVEPAVIDQLAAAVGGGGAWDMATAATPLRNPALIAQPSVVKVVAAADGRALYFSRATIPFDRDGGATRETEPVYLRHVGIYAYRRDFLERLVREPPCLTERLEKLEQLRALHLGARMKVLVVEDHGIGVDTPEDAVRAEAALRAAGLA
ncbi:MAG: 3-deoxy-manno-octulosonate cytidylyltransferase [Lentisphaerae bacterium]|nr:3-deoxy-manno-octulosonate cytidylyltransferase [Lentisphaerota bacterium]